MNDKPTTTLEQKKDRRGLLALVGAGGAAALAALFTRSNGAQAATGDNLILGQSNTADQPTFLQADQLIAASLHVENRGGGNRRAIEGVSDGDTPPIAAGVTGRNEAAGPDAGAGVFGSSQNGFGVFGASTHPQGSGVAGVSNPPEGFPLSLQARSIRSPFLFRIPLQWPRNLGREKHYRRHDPGDDHCYQEMRFAHGHTDGSVLLGERTVKRGRGLVV